MRKFILSGFMSVLFVLGTIFMVSMAPPDVYRNCKSDCQFLVELGLFSTNGKCMSACHTCTNPAQSAAVQANCICRLIDAEVGLGDIKFGECINLLK